ncbi:23S rRNA (guanosine(2251)-2'-O)-methyltransferase RlmB [Thioalkalivibrio sp. XN8]|uniref:23S rRNA (guanosine(2251)-2'-O)-methyltransferase RlmB n=1 Tax=Thioalkalivibrio sp. XN8 TaxID=2712863 RepID=UPI0013EE3815|nr:23S rRNA (guanosine(2251)-2'-O)-methyltransferase RlmB [Thioalkalivibrio sp. XN8]NGP54291.1 23S rRNA (guanosine(2251)-2'-O)-methyltransferase RlmB [Thioalkalivibrio sp. XN8]
MSTRELAWGLHPVREALQRAPERVLELWTQAGRSDDRMSEILALAGAEGIKCQAVRRETLDGMAGGGAHQGVVARLAPVAALDENDLYELLDRLQSPAFLLVLDGVQDPHNLGACLRTADAAGVHAVIIPKDRAAGLTPAARKAAAGAAETVPLVQVVNLARCLRGLKDRGIWLAGAEAGGESALQADLAGPLALVLGAEGGGLRRLTRETCDLLVSLPMKGAVESLNVSVAAGVLLYLALAQRGG